MTLQMMPSGPPSIRLIHVFSCGKAFQGRLTMGVARQWPEVGTAAQEGGDTAGGWRKQLWKGNIDGWEQGWCGNQKDNVFGCVDGTFDFLPSCVWCGCCHVVPSFFWPPSLPLSAQCPPPDNAGRHAATHNFWAPHCIPNPIANAVVLTDWMRSNLAMNSQGNHWLQ